MNSRCARATIVFLALALGACRSVPNRANGSEHASARAELDSPASPPEGARPPAAPVAVPSDIAWEDPDAAFARAAREGKPVVVVLTASWCGHCRTYQQQVLTDPGVIEASGDFVMVRVDIDQRPDLNQRYAVDGSYVPRTLFFDPSGRHLTDLHAARTQYLYFLQTTSPVELLGLMRRAAS